MDTKTVIKLNNIPHGFYEDQMRKYFAQFGQVKNTIVIRSKKTHKSRGFGFVEFALPQVARAASEAMHNYLFFNQVLKCRQMDRKDLPRALFRTKYSGENSVEGNKKKHNSGVRDKKKLRKHYKRIIKTQEQLQKLGIDFKCRIINSRSIT